ncbi:hypothetical protein C8J56DRAFT_1043448 [Mycena floridula]|nr:hypothetical protein C8J56DRAFT_1043448 [Mycena floridula]
MPPRPDNSALFAFIDLDSSPVRPTPSNTLSKRRRTNAIEDDNDEFVTTPTPAAGNQNLLASVKRIGAKKRLREEQQADLEVFATDMTAIQNIKLLAALMALDSSLSKVVQSMPAFTVSADLKTNITSIASSVLLSTHISQYKGKTALNHVMAMVKKHRYGLPPGFENNTADLEKVENVATGVLTEKRSAIKKLIRKSLTGSKGSGDEILADSTQHSTIYQLTKTLVKDTKTPVTPALAARVALMRRNYIADSGGKFWDTLDADLADIKAKALESSLARKKSVARCLAKMFEFILQDDREQHGVVAPEEDLNGDDGSDSFQDDVDVIVQDKSMQSATDESEPDSFPETSGQSGSTPAAISPSP